MKKIKAGNGAYVRNLYDKSTKYAYVYLSFNGVWIRF